MLRNNLNKGMVEAGCDEAGRGCIAGPVFAAAVILPPRFRHADLNDSKQLSESKRVRLRGMIEEHALAWSVASIGPEIIDDINILNASISAMHHAVSNLAIRPEFLLIDGNRFKPYQDIPHECIVKGDGKFASIAAASILAKTHRDEYMATLHKDFPDYGWVRNKGYPTRDHRKAVEQVGVSVHHRKSFAILPDQLKLDL